MGRDVTNVLLQALIFTGAALPFGLHVDPAGFLLLLLILAVNTALFASYSYAIALRFQNEDALVPFAQVVTLPVLLLAGFLLPMEMAPGWLKAAAHADPVYYSVAAAKALLNGHLNQPAVWQAFVVNIPLAGEWWPGQALHLKRQSVEKSNGFSEKSYKQKRKRSTLDDMQSLRAPNRNALKWLWIPVVCLTLWLTLWQVGNRRNHKEGGGMPAGIQETPTYDYPLISTWEEMVTAVPAVLCHL